MDSLKAGLLNIRSIRNKIIHVVEVLNEFQLHILCLTETWLLPSDLSVVGAALPESYSVFHVPRLTGVGGGIALIHSTALAVRHEEIDLHFSSFEVMKAKFTSYGETVQVIVV